MANTQRPSADPRIVGVISGVIVILVILVIVGLLNAGGDGEQTGAAGDLTATPLTSAAPATPTPPPTVAPSAPDPDPAPTQAAEGGGDDGPIAAVDREPTDADAAAFADVVAPAGDGDSRVVQADLDGDGRNEVVVASILGGRSRIDVAAWDGARYRLAASGEGGSADALTGVSLPDLDADPLSSEVVVEQTSGSMGSSLSAWSVSASRVQPLRASGGCWDGSHTYGIIGASTGTGTITATCDGSPAPTVAWPSDLYRWDAEVQRMAYVETLEEPTN